MIYLVTAQRALFNNPRYEIISVEKSLKLLENFKIVQFDAETTGLDARINKLRTIQFGIKSLDVQIIVDLSTIDILLYKEVLEKVLLVGHNLKFDLQFLYNHKIIPSKIYDTMIVEQFRYLGYPSSGKEYGVSYTLDSVIYRYLKVIIDKDLQADISNRDLDDTFIEYAATDVKYLEDIMNMQITWCNINKCINGAILECNFVPAIAYMEWCGIKLSEDKWKVKMDSDLDKLNTALKRLTKFIEAKSKEDSFFEQFIYIENQGDLFHGFDLEPKCSINWKSPPQVIKVAQRLGFDTLVKDKKTGEYKDSVKESVLAGQKGINDEFLKLLFDYAEHYKNVSTYGQSYIDAINPKTGRIHTQFRQLGTSTGRLASGNSNSYNRELAKLKGLHYKRVFYPQLQNLPSDAITRNSFVAEKDNNMVSCDYSGMEARLGADIYNEKNMIYEFLHGSGDMHSLVAKAIFKELKDLEVSVIKKNFPELRKKAKPVGFAMQFGGTEKAIASSLGIPLEKAKEIMFGYFSLFTGIAIFKEKGAKAVRQLGYVLINPITGHRENWPGWKDWKQRGGNSYEDKKTLAFYERTALNSPTQGTGAIILKEAVTRFFRYIIENDLFNKVLICNLIHDEVVAEFPKANPEIPQVLKSIMENVADKYCTKVPIPAEPEVGEFWIH